jgi:hypothetical protein
MDISNYTSDPDVRSLIEKRIEKSIPTPKYLKEYPKWIAKFKSGYSLEYVAAFWDVDHRLVRQALYAMDLVDEPAQPMDESLEQNLILDYYLEPDSTHGSLQEEYGISYEERVSWAVRTPALRVLIEREMNVENVEDIEDSDFTDDQIEEIEERLRENPRKYHADGTGEDDWELPEEDQIKSASDVLMF